MSDDFKESKDALKKPLPVKRFSVSTDEAIKMGLCFSANGFPTAIQTVIDDSVRRDTRKIVMTVAKDRIMYDSIKNPDFEENDNEQK